METVDAWSDPHWSPTFGNQDGKKQASTTEIPITANIDYSGIVIPGKNKRMALTAGGGGAWGYDGRNNKLTFYPQVHGGLA